jgi:hypothetical protein
MDFMDATCAALIEAKIVPVHDPSGVYNTGQWAEPDMDHAATLIERLVGDSQERTRLGQAGAARLQAFFNREEWNARVVAFLCA